MSGALLGSYHTFVQPNFWDLVLSIEFVAAVIVGGVGTLWGPLLGSIVIFGLLPVLQRYASSLPLLQSGSGGGISVSTRFKVASALPPRKGVLPASIS